MTPTSSLVLKVICYYTREYDFSNWIDIVVVAIIMRERILRRGGTGRCTSQVLDRRGQGERVTSETHGYYILLSLHRTGEIQALFLCLGSLLIK